MGLVIAAVALTACALLLWMIVKGGGDGDDGASAGTSQQPGGAGSEGAARTAPRAESSSRPGLPQVTQADQARRGGDDDDRPATETIINGVRVRDHRRDRSKPVTLPDRPPPPHVRRIDPKLTAEISDRILPIVRECGGAVPPEARSPKPRVEGQVTIAIKDHRVSVTAATVEISGVAGATLEPAKQCIQQKMLGVAVPQADEEDVESYPIQVSYTLP